MAVEPRRIHADRNTDLSDVLALANSTPVLVEKDGALYRVTPEPEDVSADYDAEAVLRAVRESAGAFAGMDTEQLKRDLLAQRGQKSRGRPA